MKKIDLTKIDLTKIVMEADGKTPYTFGFSRRADENGQPIEIPEAATFQKLLNSSLRSTKIRMEHGETKEQYNARVLSTLELAEKVAQATKDTGFSDDEIAVMQDSLAGSPVVIYGQFLRMCSK